MPAMRKAASAANRSLWRLRRLLRLPRLQVHQARPRPGRGQTDRREVPVVWGGAAGRTHRTLRAVRRVLAIPRVQVPREHQQGGQGPRRSEGPGRAMTDLWQATGVEALSLRHVQVVLGLSEVPRSEGRQERESRGLTTAG